jgi:pimeloyl-ACP methyl ester carboxylesterase
VDTSVRSGDGTRLVVRRLGAGIAVVLLHGSGGWPGQMHFATTTAPDLVAATLRRFLAAQE